MAGEGDNSPRAKRILNIIGWTCIVASAIIIPLGMHLGWHK